MKNMLWLACLVLASCTANVRRFVPPGTDTAHTAHLIAMSDPPTTVLHREGRYLFLTKVDGRPSRGDWEVASWPNDLYLMPGTHTFTVLYQHAGLTAKASFEINAKAGASYFVHRHADAYGVRFWITEGKKDGIQVGRLLP
jgi:hypothetical protein